MKQCFLLIMFLYSCSIVTRAQIPDYLPKDSLYSWYPFNGNANDSGYYSDNGTVNGCSLTVDRFGKTNSAYSFNGVSDYIDLTSTFFHGSITNHFSISFWLNLSNSGNYGIINNSSYWREFSISTNSDSSLNADWAYSSFYSGATSAKGRIIPNVWQHILVVMDSSNLLFYFNGVLLDSNNCNGAVDWSAVAGGTTILNTTFGRTQIGGLYYNYLDGKLDDIAIWDRALAACEVSKIYFGLSSLITGNPTDDSIISAYAQFSIQDTGGIADYQWQENSGSGFVNLSNSAPYSGVNTKVLTITPVISLMNNYQYRCIRNAGKCIDASNAAKLIVKNTSVETISIKDFIITPNPTNSKINIVAPIQIKNVQIINLLGQIVKDYDFNSTQVICDITDLNSGSYFLRINNLYSQRVAKE